MMAMPNYASKASLKRAIVAKTSGPLYGIDEFFETSMNGNEFKGAGSYVVVMGAPLGPRRYFATVTVNDEGIITGAV